MTESTEVIEAAQPSADEGVSLGAEYADAPPFLARYMVDETIPSDRNESGKQGHWVIKPLEFETKGAGLQTWWNMLLPNSKGQYSKQSPQFVVSEAVRRTFYSRLSGDELKKVKIGAHQLEGKVAYFIRHIIDYGTNDRGEKIQWRGFIPVGLPKPEELAAVEGGSSVSGSSTSTPSFTADELQQAANFAAGKTPKVYQREAFKSDALSQRVKDGFSDGSIIDAAVAAGLVQVDGDSMVTLLAPSE